VICESLSVNALLTILTPNVSGDPSRPGFQARGVVPAL
jgi:hypothetical protein